MVRTLSATGPRELPTPFIEEADENGFVSFESLSKGITMKIPAFSGTPGNFINIVLASRYGSYGGRAEIEDPDADIAIPVPASEALRFADATRVDLQAIYFGDPIELSPTVSFSTGAAAYAATVDEADGDVIPGTVRQATARIRPFQDMAAGDRVELYMLSSAPNASARLTLIVEASDVGTDLTFPFSTVAYWNARLHIFYEVKRGGRVLAPRVSTFDVEGPLGAACPVYLVQPGWVAPSEVALTYEGEERCLPFDVAIPDDASPGDRLTLFAVPSYGQAILVCHVIDGTEQGQARMCIPYERVAESAGTWHIGSLLEFLSGAGNTLTSPIVGFAFTGSRDAHGPVGHQ